MARTVPEWIGKTDNSKIPDTVRDRLFERHAHTCHLCKLTIKVPGETWDMDHVIALINGGENREANLAPAHKTCHVGKSAMDVKEKSKVARVRKKHNGVVKPEGRIQSAGFAKAEKRAPRASLPPRQLFERIST